ncbi:MAG: MFS transporter, partial [Solirubrobacterales bacterium]|nr:MFS transporter [Solirubrobacterales bacterium]
MDAQRTPRRAWLILALGILVYAVSVFHRASLGVAGVEAQHRFGITAAMLSLFSVLQLAVYAGMQVPVGVMLDRFGSRRLIVAGAGLMGLGQLVLAITHSVAAAVIGRVLVGAGDAMTF